MMQWLAGGVILVIWLIGVLAGKGGFLHILLLTGISIIVVETLQRIRTTQG